MKTPVNSAQVSGGVWALKILLAPNFASGPCTIG